MGLEGHWQIPVLQTAVWEPHTTIITTICWKSLDLIKKYFIKPSFSIPAPPTSQMRSGNVDHVILQLGLCRGKKILALMYNNLSVLALMLSVLNYF